MVASVAGTAPCPNTVQFRIRCSPGTAFWPITMSLPLGLRGRFGLFAQVLFQGRQDARATIDLNGASSIWFSTGNLLNANDPCAKAGG